MPRMLAMACGMDTALNKINERRTSSADTTPARRSSDLWARDEHLGVTSGSIGTPGRTPLHRHRVHRTFDFPGRGDPAIPSRTTTSCRQLPRRHGRQDRHTDDAARRSSARPTATATVGCGDAARHRRRRRGTGRPRSTTVSPRLPAPRWARHRSRPSLIAKDEPARRRSRHPELAADLRPSTTPVRWASASSAGSSCSA
jgi:hypothetical protein